jgi:chorismate dehydratase
MTQFTAFALTKKFTNQSTINKKLSQVRQLFVIIFEKLRELSMIFGSIEYLNLLPFRIFLKKYLKGNQTYQALHYNSGVPSKINSDFKSNRIDGAFISSIESTKASCSALGIIAYREVRSVFVIPNQKSKLDTASASSNILAKVLGVEGEVIIGDKALLFYLQGGQGIDLATQWYKKYRLPFVFARLCYNQKNAKEMCRLIKAFEHSSIKIPQYLLKREAKKRHISPKALQEYLKYIYYSMDYRAYRSYKLFIKKAKSLDRSLED